MVDWSDIEDAITTAVNTASGGVTAIWANQSGPKPDHPFVTMMMTGPIIRGIPSREHSYDAGGGAGAEITLESSTLDEITVSLQYFVDSADNNAVVGDLSARAALSALQANLRLDSVKAALRTAGLGLFDYGTIQHVPTIVGADFEGRATCELRFNLVNSVTETTGYIAKSNVDYTINTENAGLTGTIVVDSEA